MFKIELKGEEPKSDLDKTQNTYIIDFQYDATDNNTSLISKCFVRLILYNVYDELCIHVRANLITRESARVSLFGTSDASGSAPRHWERVGKIAFI